MMRYRLLEARRGKSGQGFTFLEVLVALCVVSVSIVALLNCHTISLRNYVYSQTISRATLLAEEKINEIEAKGFPEIDDQEAEEYENGLRYFYEEGEFYDSEAESTDVYQPVWRQEYWWSSLLEETEYEGVRKVTVEVYSRSFARKSVDIDPWDEQQISPAVRLVTYIAAANRREDARSGVQSGTRAGTRPAR
jgi:prepilin-type N-terminal cleavage/methylation domain-containing protein